MIAAAVIVTVSGEASASGVTFPIDGASEHRDIQFVKRNAGYDWFSERATLRGPVGPIFNILRGGLTPGQTVQVLFVEADCARGRTRGYAVGYGTTAQQVNDSITYINGPWQTLEPRFPETIRAKEACFGRAFLGK